jgi:hypothetical protein
MYTLNKFCINFGSMYFQISILSNTKVACSIKSPTMLFNFGIIRVVSRVFLSR